MGNIKFTFVKLIINTFTLACLLCILSTNYLNAEERYTVQIAASKTPLNIPELAEKNQITDSIIIVRSESWYRYVIGNFKTRKLASVYANELIVKTRLTNVFVQVLTEYGDTINEIADSKEIPENAEQTLIVPDSLTSHPTEVVHVESENNKLKTTSAEKKKTGYNVLNLFFTKTEITELQNYLIEYGKKHLPRNIQSWYGSVIEKSFQNSYILIFLLFILFFIINTLVVLSILNYTVKYKRHKERYFNIFSNMYEKILLSYIFGEIDWDAVKVKLKRKEKRKNRKILISILLNFKGNFKGDLEHHVFEIYTKLGLQHDSLKSARSYLNHKKVEGIMELTHLYPEGAKEIVKELINDPNNYIRSEAQTAYVRLNPDNPFDFFYTLKRPFTRWTQLSAFNLIRLYQLPIPVFAKFLDFDHSNIRNFSLRMIIYFQQLENVAEIIKFIDSKMEQTRYLVFRAINNLRLYEYCDVIKSKFWNETDKNKIEIIKALRNIGTANDYDFLEQVMKKESVSLKTEACRTMYYMNQESRAKLIQIDRVFVPEIELLIAHVTDKRN